MLDVNQSNELVLLVTDTGNDKGVLPEQGNTNTLEGGGRKERCVLVFLCRNSPPFILY